MASDHSMIVYGRAPVLNALKAAEKSIDLTIYEISDSQIMPALQAARARGVAVRVIYNWYSFPPDMQHVSESNIHARLQSTYDSDWAQPSVTMRPDKTPLKACQGDPAGRAQARRKVRP
jgi:hypothetical protein